MIDVESNISFISELSLNLTDSLLVGAINLTGSGVLNITSDNFVIDGSVYSDPGTTINIATESTTVIISGPPLSLSFIILPVMRVKVELFRF